MSVSLETHWIPNELRQLDQWVCWANRDGRKIPINARTGSPAKSNDPTTWSTFNEAFNALLLDSSLAGLGFVFADGDGLVGVDFDECIDDAGTIADWALQWLTSFDSYAEISPSGRGLKVWIRGSIERGRKTIIEERDGKSPGIEIYTSGRFFTVTGQRWEGLTESTIRECQPQIDRLHEKYFPEPKQPEPFTGTVPQRVNGRLSIPERAARYLATMPPAISGQHGHDSTYHAACVLVIGFDLSPDDAWPVFQQWNATCQPPWSEKDLRRKLDEANKLSDQRGGLVNDQLPTEAGVELAAFLQSLQGESLPDVVSTPAVRIPNEIPSDVSCPPGFIGDLVRHNLKTAWFQQPDLALSGAMALLSALTGGKIADTSGTRTNLYILGLAPSRSGKEHARKLNREICLRSAHEDILGPEEIGSHAAIYSWLAEYPTLLFQLDEIGRKFATMQDARKSPHLWNIVSVWLKLWSSADSMLKGDAYADLKKTKTLMYPHAVIYGTSVPQAVWDNLTVENVSDGLLARFLVLEGKGYRDLDANTDRIDELVPDDLIRIAAAWRDLQTTSGNLAAMSLNGNPLRIERTSEAQKRWQNHNEAVTQRRKREGDTRAAVWSGTPEKTARLALLFSASRWTGEGPLPDIEIDDMDRAVMLANHLTRQMLDRAERHVSESPEERTQNTLLEKIRQREEGMTLTELTRATRRLTPRQRKDLLQTLSDAGLISVQVRATKGRPVTFISACPDPFKTGREGTEESST